MRLLKASKHIEDDYFHLTYGDGLSDINLEKLIENHKANKKLLTITAVHPPTKFGELILKMI